MKCYLCQKTLQFQKDDPYIQPGEPSIWECPDMHATIHLDRFDDTKIVKYKIYWDGDQNAQERFRLMGQSYTDHWAKTYTNLYKIDSANIRPGSGRSYSKFPTWKLVLSLDHFLELNIKDEIIQADNLIPRLLKLKAFG